MRETERARGREGERDGGQKRLICFTMYNIRTSKDQVM